VAAVGTGRVDADERGRARLPVPDIDVHRAGDGEAADQVGRAALVGLVTPVGADAGEERARVGAVGPRAVEVDQLDGRAGLRHLERGAPEEAAFFQRLERRTVVMAASL